MNGNRDKLDRNTGSGWLVSSLLHIGLIWLFWQLTTVPSVQRPLPLELEATTETRGEKLILLDTTISTPRPDHHAVMVDILGDTRAAPQAVLIPASRRAAESGDVGRHKSTAGTRTAAAGGVGRATFFGTQAEGDRFVYIVDTSGSMNAGYGRRLRRAITELQRSIDALTPNQSFYVVLFATHTRKMFDLDEQPLLIPATEANKKRLHRWLADLKPGGGTNPTLALQIGIELQPSAVFLLSDGRFSQTRKRRVRSDQGPRMLIPGPSEALGELVRLGRNRVPIHTVAFEEFKAQENLKQLSELSSGQFSFVAAPGFPEDKKARERAAAHWLAVANKLEAQSRPDMAQQYYQKILKRFANTRAAREAERRRRQHLASHSARWMKSDRAE